MSPHIAMFIVTAWVCFTGTSGGRLYLLDTGDNGPEGEDETVIIEDYCSAFNSVGMTADPLSATCDKGWIWSNLQRKCVKRSTFRGDYSLVNSVRKATCRRGYFWSNLQGKCVNRSRT